MDYLSAFRDALQAVYGQIDIHPVADGMIHRFTVPGDRPGSNNGWYVLHAGCIASWAFGSWKAGDCHTGTSREPTDHREAEHLRNQMEQARQQREADQRQRHQAATEYARKLWRDGRRADPDHPYLIAKGCRPHTLRQLGDALLVPLTHKGELVNVQRIHPDGSKRFLSGGRVKGCCSPLGLIQAGQPLYLCEGWATGATLHESSGHPVACAMNAGNLLSVGQQLSRTHPGACLIVAGDDDRQTEGNPGKRAAATTALTLGCGLILPPWSGYEPFSLTDFNDLRQWQEGGK
ncbi:MAG: topoisomerase [Sphingopyxis sp.]|nr:MAG: topoisomerase [Sphingopyxis sp.]